VRIVLLSDTHGFVAPFIKEMARAADYVVHAGDIGGPSVLESIKPDNGELIAVRGNIDPPGKGSDKKSMGLVKLAESVQVDLPDGVLAVEHGHRIWDTRHYHERLRAKYPAARAIVYGHTHIRCCDCTQKPWVLNPGAAGQERTKGGASCMLLDANAARWQITEYRSGEISPSQSAAA
tara:strand:+ start:786 stop:1319 length:534 start_codon:yes stop_codon:yes gene_type:complete